MLKLTFARRLIGTISNRSGLGYKFLDRLDDALARIARTPEIHAIAYRNARLTLIRKFPYVLCYLFENETVYVLAVFHGHRDPSVWKSRLDD